MPIQVDEKKSLRAAPIAVLVTLMLISAILALGWRWILFVFVALAAGAGWYLHL
ncbi:hypothetical protein [Rhizobium leguminosarum]|uniref:hypothetical protein n=1 Tax=Rhizobium leguminosarum TaxID=384 RepID=UPI001427AD05|nr:hypothetical protein [Rhizobium leguminosarum]